MAAPEHPGAARRAGAPAQHESGAHAVGPAELDTERSAEYVAGRTAEHVDNPSALVDSGLLAELVEFGTARRTQYDADHVVPAEHVRDDLGPTAPHDHHDRHPEQRTGNHVISIRPGRPAAPAQAPAPRRAPLPTHHDEPVLDLVVPVFNEEKDLEPNVRRLHTHLRDTFPYPFRITIADNASTDGTARIAARLALDIAEVTSLRLPVKGRGRALRAAWSGSRAPVLAYLDVDLSTGLAALLPLVAPLISGHSDLAIGTRLASGSRVVRGPKREVISRCYNTLLHWALAVGFSDAQCGFKAVRREAAERLLPLVRDEEWFFDTELLVLAERAGLRIHEVPVDWVDDPDSSVDILATALADLRGIARMRRTLAATGTRARRPRTTA
ncbi:dolichyl-phosphate beta-glucosyltransferase [Streptomyces murinus]|uniref:dolichyl-phosphate beta-glucosyltransferase n=1 Tax=Streptomyces murinus TaxID=33900 RepID=UPI0039906626